MALESSTYVKDLNPNWPAGADDQSQGDEHFRNFKGAVMRSFERIQAKFTTGGTSTAYTLATGHFGATLEDGGLYAFILHTTNGAAATLNVDSLGAKAIFKPVAGGYVAVAGGEYPATARLIALYSASSNAFLVLNSPFSAFLDLGGGTLTGALLVNTATSPQIRALSSGFTSIAVETSGLGQQARFELRNSDRTYVWYRNQGGTYTAFHDLGGGGDRLILKDNGEIATAGPFYPVNVANYYLSWDGASTLRNHDVNDFEYFFRAGDIFGWRIGGADRGQLDVNGFKSPTNAKAWLRASGGSIIGAYNVSSITYVGAGTYVVNFSTPMPNTAYVGVAMGEQVGTNPGVNMYNNGAASHGTGSMSVSAALGTGPRGDTTWDFIVFAGGL